MTDDLNHPSAVDRSLDDDGALTPTDRAIHAIRDRLATSDAPTVGTSPMSDYENDPVTRNDLLHDLRNWIVDDPGFIYGQIAEEADADDTPEFRQAIDAELAKETDAAGSEDDSTDDHFTAYERGDLSWEDVARIEYADDLYDANRDEDVL